MTSPSTMAAAAVVRRRTRFLTAEGQIATPLEQEAQIGKSDLLDVNFVERCRLVETCVGRIRVTSPGRSGWATGFLIAHGLLMTNHHVFPGPETVGASTVEFGYWFDVAGQPPDVTEEFQLDPVQFFVANKELDMAVVAVKPRGTRAQSIERRGHLRLIPETGKIKTDEFVTILQHPDGNPMCIALRENRVERAEDAEPFIWYKADTAYGSSGAPVFNDQFQIVALHASGHIKRDQQGRYLRRNGVWVTSLDGLRETDVVWEANVGYRTSRICSAILELAKQLHPDRVPTIEAAMAGGDVLSEAVIRARAGTTTAPKPIPVDEREASMPDNKRPAQPLAIPAGPSTGLVIPLQLRVTLEHASLITQAVPTETIDPAGDLQDEAMKMQVPIIYDDLESRDGFDRQFLRLKGGEAVPMPKITQSGEKVLAPLLDGSGSELKYHHFSVWMHKTRRLALFTAANVDWRSRKKEVDGKSTARKALAGFPEGERIAEQWVEDARIDSAHQLPDIFYTDDRGAFDKGHIVRRDDMCWGDAYEDIQMANGDTFHVTNCSPQIKPFNQGTHGEENWGDLEEHIARATKKDAETACIFAGPIFGRDDRLFNGKETGGKVRVQIPSRYWKIVVVKSASGPQAYGFILKQDVRAITEKEFYVTEEWLGAFKPIKEIADAMRGWLNLDELIACDAFASVS